MALARFDCTEVFVNGPIKFLALFRAVEMHNANLDTFRTIFFGRIFTNCAFANVFNNFRFVYFRNNFLVWAPNSFFGCCKSLLEIFRHFLKTNLGINIKLMTWKTEKTLNIELTRKCQFANAHYMNWIYLNLSLSLLSPMLSALLCSALPLL